MEDHNPMAKTFVKPDSFFRKVIVETNSQGDLKTQYLVDLSSYDTSKMPNFKEGMVIYKGYTCQISTLKPSKSFPKNRIDIDPANKELRMAIMTMYDTYDRLIKEGNI